MASSGRANPLDELFHCNGIAADGRPLFAPVDAETLARLAMTPGHQPWSLAPRRQPASGLADLEIMPGVDAGDLAAAGWGVVFPYAGGGDELGRQEAIREALDELLAHRRRQAGARYAEYRGKEGFRAGQQPLDFLVEHGATLAPVDPGQGPPYYLLLVGEPAEIPLRVQYEWGASYAVGRIAFDRLADYAAYARSVVAAETGPPRPSRASFFAADAGDPLSRQGRDLLVDPLVRFVRAEPAAAGWVVDVRTGAATGKAALGDLITAADHPALLFACSHGMGFDRDDPRQARHNGALLCADYPGQGPVAEGHYLSADDLGCDTRLDGMIAVLFACFGAGTPDFDYYPGGAGAMRLPERSFIAGLPRRMLGLERGGALAVIGHVERSWNTSYVFRNLGRDVPQLSAFEGLLRVLLQGGTVGAARACFAERQAALAATLTAAIEEVERQGGDWAGSKYDLAAWWTAHNDARSYVCLGDPAVRLPIATPRPPAAASRSLAEPGGVATPSDARPPAVADLVERLRAALAEDPVEVKTYAAAGPAGTGTLRARTRLHVSGAVETWIAPGASEDGLLAMHERAVERALAYRTDLLRALAAVTS